MSIGWLLIHRKLMDKPIWKGSTPEQKVILVTLLMMVDFKPSEWEWQGEKYHTKPGEKITSIATIKTLSGKGISTQNVRAALKRFEKLEFLTNKSTKTGRLISIINWDSYQQDQHSTQHSNQHRANKEPTPNEQGNKEKKKKEPSPAKPEDTKKASRERIIKYLNAKLGTKYKPGSQKTSTLINARLNEGFSVEDFKPVIDSKISEWGNDAGQKQYLRPETLFGAKFEGYLQATKMNVSNTGTSKSNADAMAEMMAGKESIDER